MTQKPKPRLILGVKTFNRLPYLRQCLASWLMTADTVDFEWKIIVADDGSTDGTLQFLEKACPVEVTLLRNQQRYAVGQFNSILQHIESADYDLCFMADDDVLFLRGGLEHCYLTAIEQSGYPHLCWFDRDYWRLAWPSQPLHVRRLDPTGTCAGSVRVEDCLGAFFTVTPQVVEAVGYADEANFLIRGQWHVDYSMRCVRAGLNRAFPFYDANEGSRMVSVQDLYRRRYARSIAEDLPAFRSVTRPDMLAQRAEIMARPDRIYLPLLRKAPSIPTDYEFGRPSASR